MKRIMDRIEEVTIWFIKMRSVVQALVFTGFFMSLTFGYIVLMAFLDNLLISMGSMLLITFTSFFMFYTLLELKIDKEKITIWQDGEQVTIEEVDKMMNDKFNKMINDNNVKLQTMNSDEELVDLNCTESLYDKIIKLEEPKKEIVLSKYWDYLVDMFNDYVSKIKGDKK